MFRLLERCEIIVNYKKRMFCESFLYKVVNGAKGCGKAHLHEDDLVTIEQRMVVTRVCI